MADNPKPTDAQHMATQAEQVISAAAERITDTGREGLERARADATRFANRGLDIGTQAFDAYVEAGKRASARLSEVSQVLGESYSRNLADYSELSQRAISCRTVEDFVGLQSEALQRLKGQFDAQTRVYALFVDAFAASLQPIAESAATARASFRTAA